VLTAKTIQNIFGATKFLKKITFTLSNSFKSAARQ